MFLSNKHVILERKGGELLLATFDGENYHDRQSITS